MHQSDAVAASVYVASLRLTAFAAAHQRLLCVVR